MSYEDAPATKMLATHCAICSRPLVDSVSVETGIGPECRKKHGYNESVSPEARVEGNRIVYAIACGLPAIMVADSIRRLQELGFSQLSRVLTERLVSVYIEDHGDTVLVRSPFNEASLGAWRSIPGRRYIGEEKANQVPNNPRGRAALWDLLRRYYSGAIMQSNRGLTIIPTM